MAKRPISYAVLRGKVIETDLVEFGGRGGDITFLAPDPHAIADQIPIASPRLMEDLYEISLEDILDYLAELGERLHLKDNPYLQEALEYSYATAPTTKPIMDGFFHDMPFMFDKDRIRGMVDFNIGIDYLEGWKTTDINGSRVGIRAYGARTLHIVAGNGPVLGALTVIRGAVTRGDTIIKVPSNDPFTTGAIARTMVDMAPDHPVTKHLAVAYWRGGDEALESRLYQPHNIEKICAWGGFASVKHVTKYIQPGIELISLDPKRSASIVGGEALDDDAMMNEAANRIATDVATGNQTACAACRMVYVTCGTDDEGVAKLRQLGQKTYDAMMRLPEALTTKPKRYDPELKSQVDMLRLSDDFYTVIGGEDGEGAVLVSHTPDRVEFWEYLADRTVNLIPVDTIDEVLDVVDAYTQTVGVYPESLREIVRHKGALHGGQRFVSLGYAFNGPGLVGPQDGIEPMRRIVKWIISEEPLPGRKPFWECSNEEIKVVA
ncbi:long-chain-fatty-acyl-CoA reductase [Novosphingobium sp. PC22D]|uniref:acyl-CoA reductase n=1 Tax=Novosphingobium sp. PC22D TaxID=1962403 RepID=UPI000BF1CF73|nr:acyl-CoA reductase [Novosphingobium sp. PC22D]PEQ12394.1 long-chain-fatty-acyl-CoA reductase [Novosphingobium sp. PC22D]